MSMQVLCWVIAIVLFVIGAFWNPTFGRPAPGPPSLVAIGLAFGFLGFLIPAL